MNINQYHFNKVAILGTGVMGSQIAAHFANLNIPVVMLGEKDFAQQSIPKLKKQNPPPLALPSFTDRIVLGSVDNDLALLKDCDLVIEAIVENVEIKKQLFEKVAPYLHDEVVIGSNTSGLSIESICSVLPQKYQSRFFGIHFFNPPRFMSLVEIIPCATSDRTQLEKLEGFITSFVGKEVVIAKDSPGFVGNRIGVFAMLATLHHAHRLGIPPEKVDALTGSVIGKAKSATYRTADVVGLDILKNVVDNIAKNQPNDPWNKHIKLPDWIEKLIKENHLGSKTKQGVYLKKGKAIYVYDDSIGDYREQDKTVDKDIFSALKKDKNVLATIASLYKKHGTNNVYVDFLWSVHRDTILYCAYHLDKIATSVNDIDRALKAGFGWKKGVFEAWQEAGVADISKLINKDLKENHAMENIELPEWAVSDDFYRGEEAFNIETKQFTSTKTHTVYQRQIDLKTAETLLETDDVILRKLDDAIAVISFKTTMNVLGHGVLDGLEKSLDYVEQNGYAALIFASEREGVFCAGANLFEVLSACKLDRLEQGATLVSSAKQKAFELANPHLPKMKYKGSFKDVVKMGQKLVMRMKHGPVYTIAAVDGLALGGGCELLLHCDHVVANMNSYIGLVEVGVGVLPSFGGCKEMLLRSNKADGDRSALANQYFEQIAMAKVSSSIYEAQAMGYVQQDKLTVVANPKELLFESLIHAKMMRERAYIPPQKEAVMPMGDTGRANVLSAVTNFYEGHFMSDHDKYIVNCVSEIFSGMVSDGIKVSQDYLLDLEKERFMKLVATEKTQERIEHMLKTSKPLRN